MKVRFWGVRGSIPVPGPDTVRVGGNTPCVEVQTTDREVIILDAGTGIRLLGLDLVRRPVERLICVLLFSHTHWDHIQGLPFFPPARLQNSRLTILGERRVDRRLDHILAGQMVDAYLPFALSDLQADLLIKEVHDGEKVVVGNETTVFSRQLQHPPAQQRPSQRDLVGVLQVAPRWQTAGRPRHRHAERRQQTMQIRGGCLAWQVEIRGHDHFVRLLPFHPLDELADF